MSIQLEEWPDLEVPDETGCLAALANAWAMASLFTRDPWQRWVVEELIREAIAKAFSNVTVH